MKNAVSCVDLPQGDIKTVENVLSFKSEDRQMFLSSCKEERRYNDCFIIERHKLRVSRKENRVLIAEVHLAIENDFEKKIIECVDARRCGAETVIKRHRRVLSQRKVTDDIVLCTRQDEKCFDKLRKKAIELSEVTRKRIHTM